MRKNLIFLVITNYRLKIDYNAIAKKAVENGIYWFFENETGTKEKLMIKAKYDLDGKQNIKNSCDNCYDGKVCRQLENGRLYKCTICPAARHFNNYFNKQLKMEDKDSINIYKATKEEVKNFLASPVPFCRYCNVNEREYIKWGISKREITEWT